MTTLLSYMLSEVLHSNSTAGCGAPGSDWRGLFKSARYHPNPHRVAQFTILIGPIESNLVRNETGSVPRSQSPPLPNINKALPPELLLWVFDLIYAEWTGQPKPTTEVTVRRRKYPLLDAMLVCRTWHDLIVASPRYWTTVDIWIYKPVKSSRGKKKRTQKREPERITLERRLERSGELPFEVKIESNSEVDLEPIFDCLRSQEHRWQALNLFPATNFATVDQNQLRALFSIPLPCLTSLCVGPFETWTDSRGRIKSTWFEVDAPNLCMLSCERNFAIPRSTSSLKFLSLSVVCPDYPDTRVGEPRVELSGLVELRIIGQDPLSILSIFLTPALCKLVIRGMSFSPFLESLPQYQHLKELQWDDNGPRDYFNKLAPLCPNITSFANYIVGFDERELIKDKDIFLASPPRPLRKGSDITVNRRREKCLWPNLEEILLSSATCTEIAELIDALPSVQRVRVLHDPTTRGTRKNQKKERDLMKELRERVNIALRLEPWSDSRSSSDRD